MDYLYFWGIHVFVFICGCISLSFRDIYSYSTSKAYLLQIQYLGESKYNTFLIKKGWKDMNSEIEKLFKTIIVLAVCGFGLAILDVLGLWILMYSDDIFAIDFFLCTF